MEMLAFSNVLTQYGDQLRENNMVAVTGRLSVRDEKAPQMIVNQVRNMEQFSSNALQEIKPQVRAGQKLYLKISSERGSAYARTKAVLNMFPGKLPVILYLADTKLRRQTFAEPDADMLQELREILGHDAVILK